MPEEKKKTVDLAASAVFSGIVTKTACAPFDRMRLLYQVQGMFAGDGAAGVGATKYRSLYHTAKTILHEEGVPGFWRGNGANLIRASVVYAMKFGTNDWIKERMIQKRRKKMQEGSDEKLKRMSQMSGISVAELQGQPVRLGTIKLLQAGAIAGLAQKMVSYPLDLLSVRIALGVNATALSGGEKHYDSILGAAQRIKQTEGLRGFYKGFAPTLLTGVPYVMLQMTFFDVYKRQLDMWRGTKKGQDQHWIALVLTSGLAGSLAGVSAQTVVFPGDTIRKRMMSNGVDGKKRLYKNSWDCLLKIYRKEGAFALYHGVGPMCLRAVPSGAIQFAAYETAKAAFKRMRAE